MEIWKRLSIDVSEKAHKDLDYLVKRHGIKKRVLLTKIIELFREREDELMPLLFGKKEIKEKEEKEEPQSQTKTVFKINI